ncbi:MAG: glycosyltransferase family 39 protein [Thermodesulfobacteriota bacterium]
MTLLKNTDRGERLALAVILIAAGAVRFFGLETPSLWWDEILVPLTASRSLEYILDFCRSAEMHPPLFYLVSKAAMAMGADDFSLRLLPAVLGVGAVYLLYRAVRSFTDAGTGLMAAAILTVNGLHILLSREIRPYALQMALLLVAWRLLMRLLENGRWRDLILLCAVNAALFWLHYFTFHIVFAQGVALAAGMALRSGGMDLKRLAAFCAGTFLAALPVFAWFFLPSSGSRSIFSDTQYSRADVLDRITDYLGQSLFFFDLPAARIAAAILAVLGVAVLALKKPKLAAACLILLAVPLVNVLALGKAAYFSPWHVAYVTPFLAFFMASALAGLPGVKALAAALAAGGAVLILSTQHARYYETDSYRHNVFVTLFKPMARTLAGMLTPDAPVVCSNPGFANGVNWYLDRYAAPNPLRSQNVGPDGREMTLRFISAYHDFGTLGRDEASFLARAGTPLSVEKALNATVYTFKVAREPVTRIGRVPFESVLEAGLAGFYGRVHGLKDAVFCPMPGIGVTPTRNASPGRIDYVLENGAPEQPLRFFVNLQYLNAGQGNILGLHYRFDDEAPKPLAGTLGPDQKRQVQAMFDRERPFSRLTLTVEMLCADKTAQYHGGSLETLAFRRLEVFACPAGDTESCRAVWERRNMESMRLNYGSQAFLKPGGVPQTAAWESATNIADAPAPEASGWNVLGPKDPALPALLQATLRPGDGVVFYPRLSGPGDSVLVFEIMPDRTERPVFMMTGADGEWTPISAQYPLVLPGGDGERSLRIELRGRYAQLWHKDGTIFFQGSRK